VVHLAEKYGVMFYWDDENEDFVHNMKTVLLDREGNLAAVYKGTDYKLQQVINDIKNLK